MKTLPEAVARDFEADCMRLMDEGYSLYLELPISVAFPMLANLQLALRHPGNDGLAAGLVLRLARELSERLSLTPAMRAVCEAGFDPEYDVK